MATFDVNARIALTWQQEFEPILHELTVSLNTNKGRFRNESLTVAWMLLRMLNSGKRPTASQVIDAIYREMRPVRGGWGTFDSGKWFDCVPEVVAALRSRDPRSVLTI